MSDNEYDLDMIFSDPSTDLSIDELFSSPNSTTDHQHHDELRSASHNLPSQTAVVHQTEIPFHPPQDPTLLISQPETLHQASYGDQMSFPLPPRPPPNTSPLMEVGSSSSLQLQPDIAMSQTFSHPPPQNPSSLKGYNSSKSVEESLLRTSQVMEHEGKMSFWSSNKLSSHLLSPPKNFFDYNEINIEKLLNSNVDNLAFFSGMHMINSIGASTLDENPITRIVPHHIMSRLNGLGIFNNLDMEMLMCDRKLAEIACNDPRRAKKYIFSSFSSTISSSTSSTSSSFSLIMQRCS